MLRMPAFGLTGPWRDRVGFAQTMEQISGPGLRSPGTPTARRSSRVVPATRSAGCTARSRSMVALAEREATGEGLLVEVPLVESALQLSAEQVVEYTANGHLLERAGNHSPGVAPQGVYACAGTEQWLAVSVATDDQWRALVDALGNPAWAADPALSTYPGRAASRRTGSTTSSRAWAAATRRSSDRRSAHRARASPPRWSPTRGRSRRTRRCRPAASTRSRRTRSPGRT